MASPEEKTTEARRLVAQLTLAAGNLDNIAQTLREEFGVDLHELDTAVEYLRDGRDLAAFELEEYIA